MMGATQDGPSESPTEQEEKEQYWPQILAVAVACLVSINDGLLQAWSSPFMIVIIKEPDTYHITENEASYFAILPSVSMMISCFFFATLCDKIGRKKSLMLAAIPYLSSWLITIFAKNVWLFYLSRLLSGCGTGVLFTVMPAYVGEVASPKVRGMTASFLSTFNFFGQFLINVLGSYFSIQESAYICMSLPVVFIVCFYFMPESPYYFCMIGKYDQAESALRTLTRKKNARSDLENVKYVVEKQMSQRGTWKELFVAPASRRALIIAFMLRMTQLLGGMAIYTTSSQFIFDKSSGFLPTDVSSMIFMASTFTFYFTGGLFVDRYGRRTGYMVSPCLVGIFLILESVYFYLDQYHNEIDLTFLNWFPLIGLMLAVAACSLGQVAIPTVMVAELFSSNIKAKGTTFMACVFGVGMTLGNFIFYQINNVTGLCGPFLLFGCISLLSVVWTYFFLPETRGRTLDEVQEILKSGKLSLEKKENLSETPVYSIG